MRRRFPNRSVGRYSDWPLRNTRPDCSATSPTPCYCRAGTTRFAVTIRAGNSPAHQSSFTVGGQLHYVDQQRLCAPARLLQFVVGSCNALDQRVARLRQFNPRRAGLVAISNLMLSTCERIPAVFPVPPQPLAGPGRT